MGQGMKEKRTEVDTHSDSHCTCSRIRLAQQETSMSAIRDQVRQHNDVIDWEQAVPIGQDSERYSTGHGLRSQYGRGEYLTMNRDEGAYQLTYLYTGLQLYLVVNNSEDDCRRWSKHHQCW